jgi:sugar lactone lactonase YvrE
MKTHHLAALTATLLAGGAMPAAAQQFNRIATFHVVQNLPAGADVKAPTVAEIVTATPDGRLLAYTDGEGKRVGFVDIADPAAPKAAGTIAVGGEPTSLVITGGKVLVGVVTSKSFTEPSGHVAIVDLATRTQTASCDLGGQPDALALSPDGSYLTVVIENERDEKVNKGAIPQLPPGNLTIFNVKDGALDCTSRRVVDLTGIAAIAGTDPEPEYADINARNEAVVTLQENNHIAIVDLATGKVTAHFSAGTVDLDGVDTRRDGVISLDGRVTGVVREPDAVKWLDNDRFVTADEGDWNGGTRGFTIFHRDGRVLHASGTRFEYEAVRLGHYPERRNSKGIEPEGVTAATFGNDRLIFVAAERASLLGVWRDTGSEPAYIQSLPGGVGPEGLLALPARNLVITASETDRRKDGGIGSVISIYRYGPEAASYPTIVSGNDTGGKPIGWGALSGLAADPATPGRLFAITDSFYSQGRILTIDATRKPAVISRAITVTRDGKPMADLDLEGIAVAPGGGFWLASEGNPEREKNPTGSTLIRTDAEGVVQSVITLPDAIASQQTRFGFEGVAVTGSGADETVWLAVQREWKDDPKGFARILSYRPATGQWGQVRYPLEPAGEGWMGLSEITTVPGGFVLIERDNLIGPDAKVKRLTRVSLAGVEPAPLDAAQVPVLSKTTLRDLMPDLLAPKGYVLDKVEGFAVDSAGMAFAVTDNDGIDGASGETLFLPLGKLN